MSTTPQTAGPTLSELAQRYDLSKLYRARPKSLEDLPEFARCCPEYTAATLGHGEIIVDRSRTTRNTSEKCPCGCGKVGNIFCNWCDAARPAVLGAVEIPSGKWVILDQLEIDEKPLSAEMAVSA